MSGYISKIQVVVGNLLEANDIRSNDPDIDIIAHVCNMVPDRMGGFAGVLANKYPQILESDKATADMKFDDKFGSAVGVSVDNDMKVFNMYAQLNPSGAEYRPRELVYYSALIKSLKSMLKQAEQFRSGWGMNRCVIAMPMIASCRGGCDWFQVWDILNALMCEYENRRLDLRIYVLPRDTEAIDLMIPKGSMYYTMGQRIGEPPVRRANNTKGPDGFQLWTPVIQNHNQLDTGDW